jgi:hypothetical protein
MTECAPSCTLPESPSRLLGATAAAAVGVSGQDAAPPPSSDPFAGMAFRSPVPGLTSGRISDIEIDPKR